jgi:hypothetical protein
LNKRNGRRKRIYPNNPDKDLAVPVGTVEGKHHGAGPKDLLPLLAQWVTKRKENKRERERG